jgi:hypothetical protein
MSYNVNPVVVIEVVHREQWQCATTTTLHS